LPFQPVAGSQIAMPISESLVGREIALISQCAGTVTVVEPDTVGLEATLEPTSTNVAETICKFGSPSDISAAHDRLAALPGSGGEPWAALPSVGWPAAATKARPDTIATIRLKLITTFAFGTNQTRRAEQSHCSAPG
jgi:hypothetical protein